MSGRLIAERYRLTEPLGQGGMGTVWRARDELLRRDVAVKELTLPAGLDDAQRIALSQRALREARAASRLRHRGILRVHDVVAAYDRPWIVMELLAGRTLADAVNADGPLPPERAAQIGVELLEALRVAHERGVLHRDVKPANVFLCDDGRVVLADFGIATVEGDPSLTRSGALIGSPAYMAPERLRGERAGPESDLWSLGATLYAAVEGRPVFDRQTPMGMLSAALTEPVPVPRRAGALAPVLMGLLARDPAHRLVADAAGAQLARVAAGGGAWLEGEGAGLTVPDVPVPTVGVGEIPTRPPRPGARRSPVLIASIAGGAALLAAAITAALLLPGSSGAGTSTSTASPSGTSTPANPAAGRFPTAPDPCGLLTETEAKQLGVTTLGGSSRDGSDGCSWGLAGHQVLVRVEHYEPLRDATAPEAAHAAFLDRRAEASGSAAVRDAAWDEAYVVTRAQQLGDLSSSARVVARASNVLLDVTYEGGEGTAQRRQWVTQAARWAAARLP